MSFDLALKAPFDRVTPELLARLKGSVAASATLSQAEPSFPDQSAAPIGDVEELEEIFEQGEASKGQYLGYCNVHGLDPSSDLAADRFLQSLWGVDVLVIHLPKDAATVRVAFAELRALASSLGLTVHDPQAGTDIAANDSSPLPPSF